MHNKNSHTAAVVAAVNFFIIVICISTIYYDLRTIKNIYFSTVFILSTITFISSLITYFNSESKFRIITESFYCTVLLFFLICIISHTINSLVDPKLDYHMFARIIASFVFTVTWIKMVHKKITGKDTISYYKKMKKKRRLKKEKQRKKKRINQR